MTIAFCSNREHQRQRQIVDATAWFLRQRDRQNNRRVASLHCPASTARQPFDIAKVQFVEAVFTRRQDQAVIRHAGGEIGEVVTLPAGAVAAADEEDMAQFSRLTRSISVSAAPSRSDGQSRR